MDKYLLWTVHCESFLVSVVVAWKQWKLFCLYFPSILSSTLCYDISLNIIIKVIFMKCEYYMLNIFFCVIVLRNMHFACISNCNTYMEMFDSKKIGWRWIFLSCENVNIDLILRYSLRFSLDFEAFPVSRGTVHSGDRLNAIVIQALNFEDIHLLMFTHFSLCLT
jgi:hypothetical protein